MDSNVFVGIDDDDMMPGTIQQVRADGAPTRNRYLRQRQTDLLGMPVSASLQSDMAVLRANCLSAIGTEQVGLNDIHALERKTPAYEPFMSCDERAALWTIWRQNVKQVCERAG